MKAKGVGTSAVAVIVIIIAIAGIGGYFVLKGGEEKKAAEFEVSSLTLSSTEAKVGESITASTTVKNTGNATGTHRIVLTIDGEEVEAKEVTLAPRETKTVTFSITKNIQGTYIIGVGGLTRSLQVNPLTPVAFQLSNLTFNPSEVEVGQTVEISVRVTNTGELEGTYTVTLKIDYEIEATKDVTLAGGTTETVSFTVTKNTSGTYTIGVDGLQRALNVLELAAFELTNLTINPSQVNLGESVGISVDVKNEGDVSGTYTVTLRIDGTTESTQDVTLAGGENRTVSSTVTKNEAKSYSVAVDGLTGTFSVRGLLLGETAKTSEMEVTVISAEGTTFYTEEDGDVEMTPSGKIFVIIDAEIKYIGTDSEYVYAGDFWLVDLEGYKYEYASGTYSLENGFESVTLYLNQKTRGKILFEVPEDVEGLKIQCDLGSYWEPYLVSWGFELVLKPLKVLTPIADAHIEPGDRADGNFGGDSSLELDSAYIVGTYPWLMGDGTKAYIKFDLTAIPSGATINSAELKLYSWYQTETMDVSVHYCSDDTWTESGITWNNAPSYKDTATDTATVMSDGWYSWIVTQDVRSAINRGKLSLVLKMNLEGIVEYRYISINFYSKEGYKPPRLEISYTS